MNFYNFIKEYPAYKTSLSLPIEYEIDPKEIQFVRERYEQYLEFTTKEDSTGEVGKLLYPFYKEMNDAFVIRMFTINFFNLSYMEPNETIDFVFQTFARMRKEYGTVTFFQGALPYPENYNVREEDLEKDGDKMSSVIPMRLQKIDAFPKDAEISVVMLGYLNVKAIHCTIFISKDSLDEKILQLSAEAIQDEWKKYFLFTKNKKRSLFDN